jgi:16S rRNA (cytosine967-C5)-methyltransferase
VHSAVTLAGAEMPKLKGLVNAVLRRIAREGQALLEGRDALRLNTPPWLWRRWEAQYGAERTRAIAASHAAEPPLDLTCKGEPEPWALRLKGRVLPGGTVRLAKAGPVWALPGYAEGAWWVQDLAAAWPARLLGKVEGARVLDLCAAPGGKTAQLAAAGARVTALERKASRLARLKANLVRLSLAADLRLADALAFRPEAPFAFVLLDAPCSATGTIRRHPDLPWRRKESEIGELARRQDALLEAALRLLEPGGRLVYSVCSLEREEGLERIRALLARRPGLAREPITLEDLGGLAALGPFLTPEGDFRSLPSMLEELGGLDGFYAARLRLVG